MELQSALNLTLAINTLSINTLNTFTINTINTLTINTLNMNTSTLCYIIGVAVWLELDIGNVRGVSSAFSTAAARCNNCNLLLSDFHSQYTQTQTFTTNAMAS